MNNYVQMIMSICALSFSFFFEKIRQKDQLLTEWGLIMCFLPEHALIWNCPHTPGNGRQLRNLIVIVSTFIQLSIMPSTTFSSFMDRTLWTKVYRVAVSKFAPFRVMASFVWNWSIWHILRCIKFRLGGYFLSPELRSRDQLSSNILRPDLQKI